MASRLPSCSVEIGPDAQRLEQLMTVDQLAELWQVSARTIRRMVADGRIPVKRFGRAIRISVKVAAG